MYGNERGKISLKINFPTVVIKYPSRWASVRGAFPKEDALMAMTACKEIS